MKALYLVLLAVLVLILQGCYSEPTANFDYDYSDNTAPAEVTFSNTSTEADSYRWEFGDGEKSSEDNPVHSYTEWGNFNVTLHCKGRGGESSISKIVEIKRPTTYIVRNMASFDMYDVYTFYTDGTNTFDEVSHGTIYSGYQSSEWITTRSDIALLYEYYDGTAAVVSTTYPMSPNVLNYIDMTDETLVYTSESLDVNSAKEMLSRRTGVTIKSSEVEGSVGVR